MALSANALATATSIRGSILFGEKIEENIWKQRSANHECFDTVYV